MVGLDYSFCYAWLLAWCAELRTATSLLYCTIAKQDQHHDPWQPQTLVRSKPSQHREKHEITGLGLVLQ